MRKMIYMFCVSAIMIGLCGALHSESLLDRYDQSETQKMQERMKALEKEQKVLKRRVKELESREPLKVEYIKEDSGPFKDRGIYVKNPLGFGGLVFGGYFAIENEDLTDLPMTFHQNHLALDFGAILHERLKFYARYQIRHGGPDSKVGYGSYDGPGEAYIEYAWTDYLISNWFNFRAGTLIVPFGRYNLNTDAYKQDLTSRPILAVNIIPTTWREAGFGVWGKFGSDFYVGYEHYFVNGMEDDFDDTTLRTSVGTLWFDSNNPSSYASRMTFGYRKQELGVSSFSGKYNYNNDYVTGLGVDTLLTLGPFEFIGEYAEFKFDEPEGADIAELFRGYYGQLNIHFWIPVFDYTFLGKGFDDPKLTLIGRYGWVQIDDDGVTDPDTNDNEEKRLTAGFSYRPVKNWVFKFAYQWNVTEFEKLVRGNEDGYVASIAVGF